MRYAMIAVVLFANLIIGLNGEVFAQNSVPQLVNYQGLLTDENGEPIPDGMRKLQFNVYKDAIGGSPVWGPQLFEKVPVINGRFNVILGTTDTQGRSISDAFKEPERYLTLKAGDVGADLSGVREMEPRQRILSAPYALSAERAGRVDFPVQNTDWASIYFESKSDQIGDSNIVFQTYDNGNEGFVFRTKSNQEQDARERLRIDSTGLVLQGDADIRKGHGRAGNLNVANDLNVGEDLKVARTALINTVSVGARINAPEVLTNFVNGPGSGNSLKIGNNNWVIFHLRNSGPNQHPLLRGQELGLSWNPSNGRGETAFYTHAGGGWRGGYDFWTISDAQPTPLKVMEIRKNGNVWIKGELRQNSDSRSKTDVKEVVGALGCVLSLRGVSFKWKDLAGANNHREVGLIGQEVARVIPEIAYPASSSEDEPGVYSINYIGLIPFLIEAIKEQNNIIQEQEKRIFALEEK